MRIDLYVHSAEELATLSRKVDQVLTLVKTLTKMEEHMTETQDTLTAQVTTNTNVVQSAVQLIQNIAAKLQALIDAGNNDPALAALAAQLKNDDDVLAAAVVANTPAAG